MPLERKSFILFIILGLFSFENIHALVPLESLLLGDLGKKYWSQEKDPIEYIFSESQSRGKKEKDRKDKEKLALYRGFYEEGENLKNFCSMKTDIVYPHFWDRDQVKRTLVSTLQYIGLDLVSRMLPQYAKYFEFNRSEFENLVKGLVSNYCSVNLTSISLAQLQTAIINKYDHKMKLTLPTVKNNTLFPKKLYRGYSEEDMMKREFDQTIKLFKSFCSWGGSSEDLKLLVPLIRHPGIFQFVARQLSSERLSWNYVDNKVLRVNEEKTVKIACKNLICRKTSKEKFEKNTPRSIGSISYRNDFMRLYCKEFYSVDYVFKEQGPKILKMIKAQSFDDQNLLVGHFIALLTGIPDVMVRLNDLSDAEGKLRASVDSSWDKWALDKNLGHYEKFYFEESLTMDVVNSKYHFNPWKREFAVHFDINLGEMDKTAQIVGKLTTHFVLKISKKFLYWAREIWSEIDPRNTLESERIVDRLKVEIENDLGRVRSKHKEILKNADFSRFISLEILKQISEFKGEFYREGESGLVEIPVYFNFAPFALQYLRYQYLVKKNQVRAIKEEKHLSSGFGKLRY